MSETVIVHLASIYTSLQSHKHDLIIDVLNLMSLLLSSLSFSLSSLLKSLSHLSFISAQFLVLSLDGCFVVSPNKFIIFDIPLLYYIATLVSNQQIILNIFLPLILDN